MPGTTNGDFQFPIPSYGDIADGPAAFAAIGNAVDQLLSKRFKANAEITSDDTGQHLTGVRPSGDWAVEGGHVYVGKSGSTGGHKVIQWYKDGTNKQWQVHSGITSISGTGWGAQVFQDGVYKSAFGLNELGEIRTYDPVSTINRPIPWATFVGGYGVNMGGAVTQTVNVTFPGGRFTQAPAVFVTINHASWLYFGSCGYIATTGCTASCRHGDGATSSANVGVNVLAVQIMSSSALGLRAIDETPPNAVVVCHSAGCENADQEIAMRLDPNGSTFCGPCSQPIDDIREV